MADLPDILGPATLGLAIVLAGLVASAMVSSLVHWSAAGPIGLLVAAPLVPHIQVLGPVSLDDILPVVGLGLLVTRIPRPTLTSSILLRAALTAAIFITLARVISTVGNADALSNPTATMAIAFLRPAFLVAVAVAVAMSLPPELRARVVGLGLAAVGTFEALFSLVTYAIPLPGIGNRLGRAQESLASCDFRLTGTLGLSANHIGAVFVITLPITIGMAISTPGRWRWILVLAAAIQSVALYLTFTRASIGLAVLASVALLVYHRQFRLLLATALGAVVLLASFTTFACAAPVIEPPPIIVEPTPGPGEPIVQDPGFVDRFGDPSDRPALWYAAALMTLDHPTVGVGIGRMVDVMRSDPDRYVDTPFGKATNSAHNTVLLAGAETGLLGAASTLALNIALGLCALRILVLGKRYPPIYSAAGLAIIAFLGQGMLNNLFTVPATGTLLAILVGAFATGAPFKSSDSPPTDPLPAALGTDTARGPD